MNFNDILKIGVCGKCEINFTQASRCCGGLDVVKNEFLIRTENNETRQLRRRRVSEDELMIMEDEMTELLLTHKQQTTN